VYRHLLTPQRRKYKILVKSFQPGLLIVGGLKPRPFRLSHPFILLLIPRVFFIPDSPCNIDILVMCIVVAGRISGSIAGFVVRAGTFSGTGSGDGAFFLGGELERKM